MKLRFVQSCRVHLRIPVVYISEFIFRSFAVPFVPKLQMSKLMLHGLLPVHVLPLAPCACMHAFAFPLAACSRLVQLPPSGPSSCEGGPAGGAFFGSAFLSRASAATLWPRGSGLPSQSAWGQHPEITLSRDKSFIKKFWKPKSPHPLSRFLTSMFIPPGHRAWRGNWHPDNVITLLSQNRIGNYPAILFVKTVHGAKVAGVGGVVTPPNRRQQFHVEIVKWRRGSTEY